MIEILNDHIRLLAYALISISCFFSIKHHGCSKWVLWGTLLFTLISASLLFTNIYIGKLYVVQFIHTSNVVTLAVFFWIHFLSLIPDGRNKDRKKT